MIGSMNVAGIRIRDLENRRESLSLAIQAIARWAGVELHFRTINAALGLSFMISAPTDLKISLSWWMMFARDAFLIETGELLGLTFRRLEIAGAASSDPVSPEGMRHFEQNVKPLIREALERNHPVLAWQGWPDYHSYLWGVITEENDSELGFCGTTMWTQEKLLSLAAPPAIIYIVEEAQPRQPGADELLRFATGNIKKIANNQLDESFGVVTGLAAYDRWLSWLAQDPKTKPNGDRGANAHYQMARHVTHNRESACRFIDHYKDGLHDDIRPFLEAMYADCQGMVNALASARDLAAVEVLYRSEDGREALSAGVRAARDFLQAQIKTIDHLAKKLGV